MGKANQAYFLQRAAEELAAAEGAKCAAAARLHRELSLRYSLKLILPEPQATADTGVFGRPPQPRPLAIHPKPRTRRAQQSR